MRSVPRSAILACLVLLLAAPSARAQTADESRLLQIAGQAASYAGEVRALLAKGASPNVPGQGGRTAVHEAARIGAAETMQALLEAGGKPDVRDEDGNAPLHFAADAGARSMSIGSAEATIRLLLEAGGDPNLANGNGRTPLHVAARVPDSDGPARALMAGGADANRKDRQGNTPLHAAVGPNLGLPGTVGALLEGGGNPGIANGEGLTALQLFVRAGPDRGETAAILIGAGADPSRKYPNGEAPLHAAIRTGGNRERRGSPRRCSPAAPIPARRTARATSPTTSRPRAAASTARWPTPAAATGPATGPANGWRPARAASCGRGTRVNMRSGPGTQYGKVGLLEAGQEVRVTGEDGEWARIEGPQGGEAFVHASFLVEAGAQAALEPKCAGRKEGAECWKETANRRGCHVWDGYFRRRRNGYLVGRVPGRRGERPGEAGVDEGGQILGGNGCAGAGEKAGENGNPYILVGQSTGQRL